MNHFLVFFLVVFGQIIGFTFLSCLDDFLASDSLLDLFKIFFLEVLILLLDLIRGTWALGVGCFRLFFFFDLVCLWLSSSKGAFLAWFRLVGFIEDSFSLSLIVVLRLLEDWSKKLDLSTVLFLKDILDGSFSIGSFSGLFLELLNLLVGSFAMVELRLSSEYKIFVGAFLNFGHENESSMLLFKILFGGDSV